MDRKAKKNGAKSTPQIENKAVEDTPLPMTYRPLPKFKSNCSKC
jgi:hypothetical protein